jgi:hypothetical protein
MRKISRADIVAQCDRLNCIALTARVNSLLEAGKLDEAHAEVERAQQLLKEAVEYGVVRAVQERLDGGYTEVAQQILNEARDQKYPRLRAQIENCISRLPLERRRKAKQLMENCDEAAGKDRQAAVRELDAYLKSA